MGVKPPPLVACPHRPPCGGCPLLDLTPVEAAETKRRRVAEALARFPSLAGCDLAPADPAPAPCGYRTRAKLAVERPPSGPTKIGLFAPGSHRVIDIPQCRVLHPSLGPILDAVRVEVGRASVPPLHVDLRWSLHQARAHLTLVAPAGAERGALAALAERLRARCPELAGVGLRRTAGPTPRALSGETEALAGEAALVERLAGRLFHLSPGAFFQVDPTGAERLHALGRAWLAPAGARSRHLVDLFAGVGAFALALADTAEHSTAVESVPAAAEDARRSAALSGVELEVFAGGVEQFAEELISHSPDRLVVDPPRRGLAAPVLRAIGLAAPQRLAYAGCDPETVARDLDALSAFDLVARRLHTLDLFAGTAEVECLALLEHVPGSFRPALLHRSEDEVVAQKPAALPTHPQAGGGPNLRDAVRTASGLDDLQPVHRLDVGTSGPVLFARGARLRELSKAFAAGEVAKAYLALVRGVPRRQGRIQLPADGRKRAEESHYRLEEVIGGYGLVRVEPTSGKRHQIRRHLARIGHPIVGDERHGERRANRYLAETCALARPFLHLYQLAYPGPDGAPVEILSPLPPELELTLDRLENLRRQQTAGPAAAGFDEA